MEIDDALVEKILEELPSSSTRSEIGDAILETLTPAQRWLMEHWRSYVCESCGKVMVADLHGVVKKVKGEDSI